MSGFFCFQVKPFLILVSRVGTPFSFSVLVEGKLIEFVLDQCISFEPCHEKACLQGPTQTGLYNNRGLLEA